MQHCENCNAPLEDDTAETCTFCGTLTEHARRLRSERQRREEDAARQREVLAARQHEADARIAEASRLQSSRRDESARAAQTSHAMQEAHRLANRSFKWSLLGMLACGLPFGPIAGLLLAFRARQWARQTELDLARPLIAMALAIGCLVPSLGFWTAAIIGVNGKIEHEDELHAKVARGEDAAQLSVETACAAAELELLSTRLDDFDSNAQLTCGARMVQRNSDAMLLDSHFRKNGKDQPFVACFHHKARWAITQVRHDERCDQPPPSPPKPAEKSAPRKSR